MQPVDQMLTSWIREQFSAAFAGAGVDFSDVRAVASANRSFGDYQCNDAMRLAKDLKMAPRAISEKVLSDVDLPDYIEKVDIAGPGFINMHLSPVWVGARLCGIATDERLGVPASGEGKTVVFDYSSPNVAKPMHIGHIRSTIIGNALDRMHRFLGYTVMADNHIGDWGTQFGILIMGYRNFVDEEALKTAPVEELERVYVKSYGMTQQDDTWMDRCRAELVKLQNGDTENRKLWEEFISLSLTEFQRIYDRLDVKFDLVRGESFYRDDVPAVMARLQESGLAEESEGAQVVFLEEEKLPVCIVQKSDGASNYATTDIATVLHRIEEFSPERIVYVTDERQQLHFKQFFAICSRLGLATQLEHVWFGLMRLPDATFSTREGNVIKLERLLDEAESRALAMVKSASPDMPHDQQQEVARAVGIGAVKYADLSQNPQTTVTFTWEKALALDGNSGPYLQYACARISSVLDKYRDAYPDTDLSTAEVALQEPVEQELAAKLLRFSEVVAAAASTYKPSTLADYLYDLAQTYSSFYQNVPFLKAPDGVRESRIRLCQVVLLVLRKGLELLGIATPERI